MMSPHCKSMDTVKMGHYFTKSGEKRQRYKCKGCWRIYVPNPIKPRNYPEEFKETVVRAVVKEGIRQHIKVTQQNFRCIKLQRNIETTTSIVYLY